MFKIIQAKKIWFIASSIFVFLSLLAFGLFGLNLGIDFTGGSLLELKFTGQAPANADVEEALADLSLPSATFQPIGENGLLIRTISLTEEQHQEILNRLQALAGGPDSVDKTVPLSAEDLGLEGEGLEGLQIEALVGDSGEPAFEELRFDSIGPVIGSELRQKAVWAIVIVLLAIIAYIAYAFRKVSYPVESWKYGLSAIIALAHDIIIITGVFAVLGHFFAVQVDAYFVTALLTVLGFSVHDTIVTFDRTRENLRRHQDQTFEEVINLSVNETLVRSLNTSLTTILALLAVILFGGATIKYFVLALLLGAVVGTYSSIFVASPLLVIWYKLKKY